MNINLARNLDYFLGIPICFLLSLINNLKKMLTFKKTDKIIPKKIIFLGLSEMGSTILAYPAIKIAKVTYPQAELYFWTFRENAEAVELLEIIPKENIITLQTNNLHLLFIDTLKSLWLIRKNKIDAVVDMELFSRFSSFLSYLTSANLRIGFYKFNLEGLYRGDFHTHKVIYNSYIHISKNFFNLVESLAIHPDESPLLKKEQVDIELLLPSVSSNEEVKRSIFSKLKKENNTVTEQSRIVIINPGFDDKLNIRKWPVEYYLKLTRSIVELQDIFVVLVGLGGGGSIIFREINKCIDLIGKTTIGDLISLFGISDVLVSHDSGIIHIASLTDINIIALFGPETPVLYAPLNRNKIIFYLHFYCSPCLSAYNYRNSSCKDNKCMKSIRVEDVFFAVKQTLQSRHNFNRWTNAIC